MPEMFEVLQYTETEVNNMLDLGTSLLLGMEVTRECHICIRKLMPEKFTKTLK